MTENIREAEGAIGRDGKRIEFPEKARLLHKMLGDWKMTSTGHMMGQGVSGTGSWCEALTAGGFAINGRQRMFGPDGEIAYRATDLWGYDPANDEFHYLYVDNAAQAHELKGHLVETNKLELQYRGLQDGKDYVEDAEVDFVSDDEIKMKVSGKIDSSPLWDFEADFIKSA
jgi:hypothetical protein